MTKSILLLLVLFSFSIQLLAQSVAINTDGSAANASSLLDIKSTTKGLLIPRMTTAQRTAIATPAKGLIVFDITTSSFWFHDGMAWEVLSTGSSSNYWSLNGSDIYNNTSGNVGIGTAAPSAYGHGGDNMITEISNPNTGSNVQSHLILSSNGTSGSTGGITWASLNVAGTDKRLGFIGDVYETANAARMVFYTRNEAGNLGEKLTVLGNGNVGIGTITPLAKLSVQTGTDNYGIIHSDGTITVGTYVGNGKGWLGTKSNHPLSFFTYNSTEQMTLLINGNFGIGTITPQAKLHIAGSVKIDGNNSIEFGAGVSKELNAGKIGYQTFTADALDIVGAGTTGSNRRIKFWNEGGAIFGGSVTIDNGTNSIGISQSNSATSLVSSTDIILMPRANGHGRVGINTTTPRAPLDVVDYVAFQTPGSYDYLNLGSAIQGIERCNSCTANVSIYAQSAVYAFEFDAFSDSRIKKIIGISNNTNDLQTINALQITDYTMKDKIKYGNKPYKKVIAQEVEKVYPQVVSKHDDFIPNVYQLTNKIEKTPAGYLLSFTNKHNICNTAKKLRVLLSETEAMQEVDIVSIPSSTQVIINASDIKSDKVFVYGEEVDDFRTVDYEGLTTLNISATQELSKLIKKQQIIIETQQQQIDLLLKRVEAVEKK